VVVVLENCAVGVAARVCGVVVRAIVVHGPVEELQVAVAAECIQVEEIGHAEFAEAKLDPPRRNGSGEMELVPILFDALAGEGNDLAQHHTREVGRLAQSRIAHDVEIRESCEPERRADAVAARAFRVEKNFGGGCKFVTEKQRIDF